MLDLSNAKKVVLSNYENYQERTCHTGGNYAFFTIYEKEESNDRWKVSYETTSEFAYCPVCGTFNDHIIDYTKDNEAIYDCGEFHHVTTKELEKIVCSFHEDEEHTIETEV